MYDVAVIGAGVTGGMLARELSKYKLKICILEKENDVAMGATKANSAIVHAGFDAAEGSLKAKLNVKGSEMMESITKELGVKYKRNGAFVVGFSEADRENIKKLLERGIKNGVKGLKIIDGDELRQLEPGISEKAICALHVPTSAIVCPYELTIAAVGNAMDNGAELKLGFKVSDIKKEENFYIISSENETVKAEYVVNAAGCYSDEIAAMIGDNSFKITPRRGEYILHDKEYGGTVSATIFRTPGKMGKGILIAPTVDGNLLTGPTAEDITEKDDTKTTAEGFEKIIFQTAETVPKFKFNKSITSFCGVRATGNTGDFIINSPLKGFINAAGIESPGLSSAPAIAVYIANMLKKEGLKLNKNESFNPIRRPAHFFKELSREEKNELIKKDKSYGKVVCRCETITEGEILYAMRQNPKPSDLDGIKRRTRAQMGRCQGGFCSPYIVELISKELGIPYEKVTKCGGKSFVNVGKTKGDE